MNIFLKLFRIKGVTFKKKFGHIYKIISHERNRQKVEPKKSSEVNLFVVDPECQGRGWGKQLLNEFIAACQKSGIKRVIVETDDESNIGFYEHF